jgi:hypothetical protein
MQISRCELRHRHLGSRLRATRYGGQAVAGFGSPAEGEAMEPASPRHSKGGLGPLLCWKVLWTLESGACNRVSGVADDAPRPPVT